MSHGGPEDLPRVAVLTNVIPSYRRGFFERLFRRGDIHVHVFCQDRIPGSNLKTVHQDFPSRVTLVRQFSLGGEALVWRFLPWRRLIDDFDIVFVVGNPRILSDALLGSYLVLTGRKVVVWTSAHSFTSSAWRERLRLSWTKIFRYVFLYTDAEVEVLRRQGFGDQIMFGMNNGHDQVLIDRVASRWPPDRVEEWKVARGLSGKKPLLSCARLVRKNDYVLGLRAFALALRRAPDLHWSIVGSGDQEEPLKAEARRLGIEQDVSFVGEFYDEETLAPFFLSALAFLHPAAIGLSLLHAYGYGLPVIVHDRPDLHGPEISAFADGLTGYDYVFDDAQSLADVMIQATDNEEARAEMGGRVLEIARTRFNVDVMVDRFVLMVRNACSGASRTPERGSRHGI